MVPAQRWDVEEYYAPDASRNLTMDVRLAAFVTDFDKFDAAAFRYTSIPSQQAHRHLPLLTFNIAWTVCRPTRLWAHF